MYYYSPDTTNFLFPGDSLQVYGKIVPLTSSTNPLLSNYQHYLKQKDVFHRFISVSPVRITHPSRKLYFRFQHLRQQLINRIDLIFRDTLSASLVKALCLGYKNDLNTSVRSLFSTTGTLHLLAVSGLHTGAVYLFIGQLFFSLGIRSPRKRLLILPLLWAYACLTGLSPSVVRAAWILSFLQIGKTFAQDYSPINFIAASALITLIFQPTLLRSVSMQLSYTAYSGIVLLHPYFRQFHSRVPFLPTPLYNLFSLSLAAQLATCPLCAYYFHSFCLNSFLINILAVPLATLLLYSSLIILILPPFLHINLSFIPVGLAHLLIFLLQQFSVIAISINNLYPSVLQIVATYSFLLLLLLYLKTRKKMAFCFWGLVLLLFCAKYGSTYFLEKHKKQIIVTRSNYKNYFFLQHKGRYRLLNKTGDKQANRSFTSSFSQRNIEILSFEYGFISGNLCYLSPVYTSGPSDLILLQTRHSTKNILINRPLIPEQIFTSATTLPDKVIYIHSDTSVYLNNWTTYCYSHNISFSIYPVSDFLILRLK